MYHERTAGRQSLVHDQRSAPVTQSIGSEPLVVNPLYTTRGQRLWLGVSGANLWSSIPCTRPEVSAWDTEYQARTYGRQSLVHDQRSAPGTQSIRSEPLVDSSFYTTRGPHLWLGVSGANLWLAIPCTRPEVRAWDSDHHERTSGRQSLVHDQRSAPGTQSIMSGPLVGNPLYTISGPLMGLRLFWVNLWSAIPCTRPEVRAWDSDYPERTSGRQSLVHDQRSAPGTQNIRRESLVGNPLYTTRGQRRGLKVSWENLWSTIPCTRPEVTASGLRVSGANLWLAIPCTWPDVSPGDSEYRRESLVGNPLHTTRDQRLGLNVSWENLWSTIPCTRPVVSPWESEYQERISGRQSLVHDQRSAPGTRIILRGHLLGNPLYTTRGQPLGLRISGENLWLVIPCTQPEVSAWDSTYHERTSGRQSLVHDQRSRLGLWVSGANLWLAIPCTQPEVSAWDSEYPERTSGRQSLVNDQRSAPGTQSIRREPLVGNPLYTTRGPRLGLGVSGANLWLAIPCSRPEVSAWDSKYYERTSNRQSLVHDQRSAHVTRSIMHGPLVDNPLYTTRCPRLGLRSAWTNLWSSISCTWTEVRACESTYHAWTSGRQSLVHDQRSAHGTQSIVSEHLIDNPCIQRDVESDTGARTHVLKWICNGKLVRPDLIR